MCGAGWWFWKSVFYCSVYFLLKNATLLRKIIVTLHLVFLDFEFVFIILHLADPFTFACSEYRLNWLQMAVNGDRCGFVSLSAALSGRLNSLQKPSSSMQPSILEAKLTACFVFTERCGENFVYSLCKWDISLAFSLTANAHIYVYTQWTRSSAVNWSMDFHGSQWSCGNLHQLRVWPNRYVYSIYTFRSWFSEVLSSRRSRWFSALLNIKPLGLKPTNMLQCVLPTLAFTGIIQGALSYVCKIGSI